MSRVQISSQAWGTVQNRSGTALSGITVTLSGTVYTDESGSTPVSPLVTDTNGVIPGWIATGSYTLTHPGGTQRVEAIAGSQVVSVESAAARRYVPMRFDLFASRGGDGNGWAANGVVGSYDYLTAFSASAYKIPAYITGTVHEARAVVIWTPNSVNAGVQFTAFESALVNEVVWATLTGPETTPVPDTADVTTALQAVFDSSVDMFVGFKVKNTTAPAPVLYAVWVEATLEI